MLEHHKYINPLTDFGFKKLGGVIQNMMSNFTPARY